jgi:hypothetical protein
LVVRFQLSVFRVSAFVPPPSAFSFSAFRISAFPLRVPVPISGLTRFLTFDLREILKSKRALRRELASRPVAEKLRMLDALRERALAIRPAKPARGANVLREVPPPCGKSDDASAVRS